MTRALSANTQAILLLTAPLIAGRADTSIELLSPVEYKGIARRLRELQRQPADLLAPDAGELLAACKPVIAEGRLRQLLGRGFLLSQVIERWQTRAIWVVSRADADYPRRLKARLREDAPAVLYGCGEVGLLDVGGLAVIGSRSLDEGLLAYAAAVGALAAQAGRGLVLGGAAGVDQAAMRGALDGGGKITGVLADSLEKSAMNRDNRNALLAGQLVLVSPCDPSAGADEGHAMARDKLICAFADASLVMSAERGKGDAWVEASEHIEAGKLGPVFVRSTGEPSAGLEALQKMGALPWPNPQDADSFEAIFTARIADTAPTPADQLFAAVRTAITQLLNETLKDTEIATALDVSTAQAKTWLQRLVDEGLVDKLARPTRFALKRKDLFEEAPHPR